MIIDSIVDSIMYLCITVSNLSLTYFFLVDELFFFPRIVFISKLYSNENQLEDPLSDPLSSELSISMGSISMTL